LGFEYRSTIREEIEMSLRINQNMSALTAHRFMQTNDANMGKSIEKLSSGLRINTAADDAAGLVASEYMRTQISGLAQASRNTQDGINIIKTAESALGEVEKQLRNIRDLSLHAAKTKATPNWLPQTRRRLTRHWTRSTALPTRRSLPARNC
jgi:flagellin